MGYLFTSESVSEGHPDKVADQISDALLDEMLRFDPESKVACETMVTTGLTICSGEVKTKGYVDIQKIARNVIKKIGYTDAAYRFDYNSCGVISTIHEQSADINQGVEREAEELQGAGDQGMMFGFANKEMDNFMPMPVELSHILLQELAEIRRENKEMKYLRPDSKSQVTIEYDDEGNPFRIDTIVISSDNARFYEADTDMAGDNDEIYFNSLTGEGATQAITITLSITETNMDTVSGETAFSDSPTDSVDDGWTLDYSIEADAATYTDLTVTVTDAAGNIDTYDVDFTQDNVNPSIAVTSISESSDYLYSPSLDQIYFGDDMGSAQSFTIGGDATDGGSGLDEVTYSNLL